jgi:hypothetical protein
MYLSKLELKQLELLRKKTPAERFSMMFNLINTQIKAIKAGIRHDKGDISEEELEKCFKEKMMQIYSMKR